MNQPQPHEQSEWSEHYTQLISGDILEILKQQAVSVPVFFRSIRSLENYAYGPEKWTVKEVLGHLIDTERILVYRILCFARGEQQTMPGFDENEYVMAANFNTRLLDDLCEEFHQLRKANLFLFQSLSETELDKKGHSWKSILSVRALIYVCGGHVIHHLNVINERYL